MMEKLGFLVCVWLLICGSCLGGFSVEKNCLEITAPDSLKGVWGCSLGNFGLPQYRGTLHGVVVYPKTNNKGCKSFDQFGISFKSRPGGSPIIVLVDRGDCYFQLKAWHAQNAGAAAVLVADDIVEPLITMDTPENGEYQIPIRSALISKSLGDELRKSLSGNHPWNEVVSITLNWPEAHLGLPSEQVEYENASPEEKVDYEFWINIQSDCGPKCQHQIEFFKSFKGVARSLEQKGYIKFTPHYMTWYCPEAFILSRQCKSQCIYHGRYCAPDPNGKFSEGYQGKDVVLQNLIQACFFKVAKESGKPWVWWDYVTEFATRCSMKDRKYNPYCAYQVIQSLGFDLKKIAICAGDPHADEENQILKTEQDAQSAQGSRGAITMLPSLFINDRKYKGKLEKVAVLKAICAAFPAATRAGLSAECGEAPEQPLSLLGDQ